jgi:hypothetical protein
MRRINGLYLWRYGENPIIWMALDQRMPIALNYETLPIESILTVCYLHTSELPDLPGSLLAGIRSLRD